VSESVELSNPQQQCEPGPVGDRATVSVNLLPFAMLALSAGLAFSVNGGSNGKLIAEAGLTAAAASWMVMILALRRSWEQRPWLGVALLAGLIALMAALVIVNPTFGFFTWTGYIWTFRLVQDEGWRMAGIVLTAAVTGTSQQVAAGRAVSKHLGDSRNLGKAGPSADPARRSHGRRHCDARVWRNSGADNYRGWRPALLPACYFCNLYLEEPAATRR
jgi:hypothetical protein